MGLNDRMEFDHVIEVLPDGSVRDRPVIWEVCPTCHGEGTLGGYPGVYIQEDFAEDPDFFDDYMNHRRTCEQCNGRTTVRTADTDAADEETRRAWINYARDVAESYAIEAQERRMGA